MMSSDKYTVTFRGAERKYRYVEKGEVIASNVNNQWQLTQVCKDSWKKQTALLSEVRSCFTLF